MILEGIVTSVNEDGTINISPMGPRVDTPLQQFELRPFKTSRTFANLHRTRCGVLHVTDDALLFAQAAIHHWIETPSLTDNAHVDGQRLESASLGLEFEVTYIDEALDRSSIHCRVVHRHQGPRLFGFNRARNAVLEAAILATRIDFLPREEIETKYAELATIVGKTGGNRERLAMDLLQQYVACPKEQPFAFRR